MYSSSKVYRLENRLEKNNIKEQISCIIKRNLLREISITSISLSITIYYLYYIIFTLKFYNLNADEEYIFDAFKFIYVLCWHNDRLPNRRDEWSIVKGEHVGSKFLIKKPRSISPSSCISRNPCEREELRSVAVLA